jgi:RNA polymerase sigma-70 factor, ECF subfamily
MDETDLIRRAAAGEIAAFERLVERKRERVFWIARHVVGDDELARDVAQDVFLRLFRIIRRFRSGGPFDAWLYRITLNLAIDRRRRERPHRDAARLDAPGTGGGRGIDPGSGAAPGALIAPPSAGEGLRRREVARIFAELSALLPKKQRFAFILREIEGLSTVEVAAILRTRESTVRNHVLQARRVLQEELRRRYPEYCRPPGRGTR